MTKIRKYSYAAEFSLAIPDMKVLERVFSFRRNRGYEESSKVVSVQINKVIYIPICEEDLITADNLDNTDLPHMIANDINWDYKSELDIYDPNKFIKARLVSDFDWINKNSDQSSENLMTVDAIILDFHGGGFMFGSSNKQLKYTSYFSKHTGWPIISVDYRLAPDYKFPSSLNDWWQAYLWIIKYSEKYLHLRFNKIIIEGHSAGSNLGMSVITLSIQKGTRIPDGVMLVYPPMTCTLDSFSPSLLLSLDDIMLNATMLLLILKLYAGETSNITSHYLFSPKFIPDKYLEKFPPWRFMIGGLDPLRDESIRMTVRLLKLNIDVKLLEYRYWFHGFINQYKSPFFLKETKDAISRASDFITELIELK